MSAFLYVAFLLAAGVSVVTSEETGYIEYLPGTLNIILSAPHGGLDVTDTIPDRVRGCYVNGACVWKHNCRATDDETKCGATTVTDSHTQRLTREVREELYNLTGEYPHAVINKLIRTKMDPNRDKPEAAFGDPQAEKVWTEYHSSMNTTKATMTRGIVFDIHGHSRDEWAMLGYLISKEELKDGGFTHNKTSIRALIENEGTDNFEKILRGVDSFGAYLEAENFAAVPSPTNQNAGDKRYYKGAYITVMHGSRTQGKVDAIQVESPGTFRGERFDEYTKGLANTMLKFYTKYYKDKLTNESDPKNSAEKSLSPNWVPMIALILSVYAMVIKSM